MQVVKLIRSCAGVNPLYVCRQSNFSLKAFVSSIFGMLSRKAAPSVAFQWFDAAQRTTMTCKKCGVHAAAASDAKPGGMFLKDFEAKGQIFVEYETRFQLLC